MSETEPLCPACQTPLERANAPTGIRFQCSACQGVTVALPIFRRVLTDGTGSAVWMASANEPELGHPCGFCARQMRSTSVPGDGDHGATVEVCRVCEMVWTPGGQATLLPMRTDAAAAPLVQKGPPTRCPECGAPFQVGEDGCCPFCHRRVEERPDVVLVYADAAPGNPRYHSGAQRTIASSAAEVALGLLFGG